MDGHHAYSWWRHQMETFSALLAICAGNSPVPGEFPTQRPVTRSFDVYFDLRPNKQLSKQWRGWWFETPSWSLWRHRNVSNVSADETSRHDRHCCPRQTVRHTALRRRFVVHCKMWAADGVSSGTATYDWWRPLVHLYYDVTMGSSTIKTWCSCRSFKGVLPCCWRKFNIRTQTNANKYSNLKRSVQR